MSETEGLIECINRYLRALDPKYVRYVYYFSRRMYLTTFGKEQVQ